MSERTETLSFRLPADLAKDLKELATRGGDSPGEYARRIVIDAITNRHHDELVELKDTVQKLREDFATAVAALLSKAGTVKPREAEEWVKRTLQV